MWYAVLVDFYTDEPIALVTTEVSTLYCILKLTEVIKIKYDIVNIYLVKDTLLAFEIFKKKETPLYSFFLEKRNEKTDVEVKVNIHKKLIGIDLPSITIGIKLTEYSNVSVYHIFFSFRIVRKVNHPFADYICNAVEENIENTEVILDSFNIKRYKTIRDLVEEILIRVRVIIISKRLNVILTFLRENKRLEITKDELVDLINKLFNVAIDEVKKMEV